MTRNIPRIIFPLFLILLGCVTAEFAPTKIGQLYPPRTSPEAIEIFRSAQPTQKFSEIGTVSTCCNLNFEKSVTLMRKTASERGGDALTNLEVDANGGAIATLIRYQ